MANSAACNCLHPQHTLTQTNMWQHLDADPSQSPVEHFRCLFWRILTSCLHWGEKQNTGSQRGKTHPWPVQQLICPPREAYQDMVKSCHWRPAPAQAHHCPFRPLFLSEESRMALYNPTELLLASEGKRCCTKWCQKFRNCSVRKTSISFSFPT